DVVTNDLLPRSVREAAEDAHLRRRMVTPDLQDAAAVDPLGDEMREELIARRVVANDGHRQRHAAEGDDVVDGVATAAEENVFAILAEDQHRRLAGDALRRAVDEAVGHNVAVDDDQPPGHRLGQLEQPRPRKHGRRITYAVCGASAALRASFSPAVSTFSRSINR